MLCDAAVFDATDMRWRAVEFTPFKRCAHSAVVVLSGASSAGAETQLWWMRLSSADALSRCCAASQLRARHVAGPGEHKVAAALTCVLWLISAGAGAAAAADQPEAAGPGPGSSRPPARVLVYGGFSGEAVDGDVLQLDGATLDIELLRRGPRDSDKQGTVPPERFAHCAVAVPASAAVLRAVGAAPGAAGNRAGAPAGGEAAAGAQRHAMLVFGGVNPKEDLNDVAVWLDG